ncbi:hypothetical protein [Spartinivicinus poritis]|uniref:Uncharacterized protein n=1 Tax=Spartinivicinus poritis TaxID=2994640 RepID=A0ABT5UCJ8_9GAMM|nr:hypothetical protein [Spartinivicinus sp. A2-2]MDE1464092.1 hypothetical protein [Spartinivicinus sp. A2-2]
MTDRLVLVVLANYAVLASLLAVVLVWLLIKQHRISIIKKKLFDNRKVISSLQAILDDMQEELDESGETVPQEWLIDPINKRQINSLRKQVLTIETAALKHKEPEDRDKESSKGYNSLFEKLQKGFQKALSIKAPTYEVYLKEQLEMLIEYEKQFDKVQLACFNANQLSITDVICLRKSLIHYELETIRGRLEKAEYQERLNQKIIHYFKSIAPEAEVIEIPTAASEQSAKTESVEQGEGLENAYAELAIQQSNQKINSYQDQISNLEHIIKLNEAMIGKLKKDKLGEGEDDIYQKELEELLEQSQKLIKQLRREILDYKEEIEKLEEKNNKLEKGIPVEEVEEDQAANDALAQLFERYSMDMSRKEQEIQQLKNEKNALLQKLKQTAVTGTSMDGHYKEAYEEAIQKIKRMTQEYHLLNKMYLDLKNK